MCHVAAKDNRQQKPGVSMLMKCKHITNIINCEEKMRQIDRYSNYVLEHNEINERNIPLRTETSLKRVF